ncbi:unnamed protein product [Leptidea sinapis]|uniref:UDP-N-acetylglucosamine transferase subunit ALG14 n=1 Tax=Leptidea sinapis TaxID=189913 RepID=A0A5E4QV49_9NEOP|nr:unnamed protein product [Leptidea sinapis]
MLSGNVRASYAFCNGQPCIWNPKNNKHKNRTLVNDAWVRIKNKYSVPCSVEESKKKRNSLLTQYREHLKKIKESTKTQNKLNVEKKSLKVILCIGSGGHTTELLKIVTKMNLTKYSPRLYMMADSDNNSEAKINSVEKDTKDYQICKIPRSRNVHQPYMTSIFSTLHAVLYCVPPILRFRPDVIICNGPGTCIPICFVVFLMRCSYILDCRIVFIESLCRCSGHNFIGCLGEVCILVDLLKLDYKQ